MEIILPGANIETLIDSHIKTTEELNSRIISERRTAEETATIALVRQFQNEFSTFVSTEVQSSLPLQFLHPKEVSIFSVSCYFLYLDVGISIRRSPAGWEISHDGENIETQPEMLQRKLLLELAKIREKINQA